jgi:outer membrane protein OmpA-like peptidoglycan-associated protein
VTEERNDADDGQTTAAGDIGSGAAETVPPPVPTGDLELSLADGELTISGTEPDEASATAIDDAARNVFGDAASVRVEVDPAVEGPPWSDGLPAVIQGFGGLIDGSLRIDGEAAELEAVAPDRTSLRRLTDALAPEYGFPPLATDATSVTTETAPSILATADDGVLTLTGTVPSTGIRNGIVQAGAELYDEIDVADELEIDPATYSTPEWRRFAEVLAVFASLGDFQIGIDGGTFHGVTEDGIEFSRDEADLDDEAAEALEQLSPLLIRSGLRVRIVGYAEDADGDAAVDLAQARADSVAEVLQGAGTDRSQITASDAGEDIDDGRRVVVVIGSPG